MKSIQIHHAPNTEGVVIMAVLDGLNDPAISIDEDIKIQRDEGHKLAELFCDHLPYHTVQELHRVLGNEL